MMKLKGLLIMALLVVYTCARIEKHFHYHFDKVKEDNEYSLIDIDLLKKCIRERCRTIPIADEEKYSLCGYKCGEDINKGVYKKH